MPCNEAVCRLGNRRPTAVVFISMPTFNDVSLVGVGVGGASGRRLAEL